jgi:hypothetical protein
MSDPMQDHWAAPLIGLPWVAGTRDCWSFAREVWRDRFGWDVPPVDVDPASPLAARRAFAAAPEAEGWIPVARPSEGCAVLMARGQRPCHVGVWIEPQTETGLTGGVLHAVEGQGVIFTRLSALAAMGWTVAGFWRRA